MVLARECQWSLINIFLNLAFCYPSFITGKQYNFVRSMEITTIACFYSSTTPFYRTAKALDNYMLNEKINPRVIRQGQ